MRSIYALLITAALVAAAPASAHHSAAMFDQTTILTLEGAVSRFDWRNPHVYIYVETSDNSGQLVDWEIEAETTAIMTRGGWTPTTLTPGTPVSVQVNPALNAQRNHALLVSLRKDDGVSLTRRNGGRASRVPATSIAGACDEHRGYLGSRD